MTNQEDSALLKAYIKAWTKYFHQCFYLPKPFVQVEQALLSKMVAANKKSIGDQGLVSKVRLNSANFI